MTVTRYRYDPDLDAVVQIYSHNGPEVETCHQIMPDIRHFVTQDGKEITSRSKLREYERATGSKQVGRDWSGSVKPAWWDLHREMERDRERRGR